MALSERFYKKISPDPNSGCWLWIGAAFNHGYGQMRINGKIKSAHRASWEIHNGDIPNDLFVCHKCDVKLCVNPDHLFLGTNSDNMKDMNDKKRHGTKYKEFCVNGHSRTHENLILNGKKSPNKRCRVCHNIQEANRRKTKKIREAALWR